MEEQLTVVYLKVFVFGTFNQALLLILRYRVAIEAGDYLSMFNVAFDCCSARFINLATSV
jgi:hypothetical protein